MMPGFFLSFGGNSDSPVAFDTPGVNESPNISAYFKKFLRFIILFTARNLLDYMLNIKRRYLLWLCFI